MTTEPKFIKTNDGSLSLMIHNEPMHNKAGALSETLHVYEPIVQHIAQNTLPPHVLSLGLGIGYVEIMICAFMLRYQPERIQELKLISYEQDHMLRENFSNFILGNRICSVEFEACYRDIAGRISAHYQICSKVLLETMEVLLLENKITLQKNLSPNEKLPFFLSGICFDPYSVESNPSAWETPIFDFLFENSHHSCCFATYASRSHLKRILKENNFVVEKRAGFGGKRECTFATRMS